MQMAFNRAEKARTNRLSQACLTVQTAFRRHMYEHDYQVGRASDGRRKGGEEGGRCPRVAPITIAELKPTTARTVRNVSVSRFFSKCTKQNRGTNQPTNDNTNEGIVGNASFYLNVSKRTSQNRGTNQTNDHTNEGMPNSHDNNTIVDQE